MELMFTMHLGFTIVALLVTLLILLKGTRNFVYRTLGLISFAVLLISISFGYMDLIGKPKPLTYEQWTQRESNEESKSDSDGKESESEAKGENEGDGESGEAEGEESVGASGGGQPSGILTMDILEWEENMDANEAYLWMREMQKEGEDKKPLESYSFQTDTEDGKELLKQLREADQAARRRGMRGGQPGSGTGIQMNVYIDLLWMAPKERFKFFVPPPKMIPEKTVPEQGTRYGTTTPSPMTGGGRPGGRPRPGGPGQ